MGGAGEKAQEDAGIGIVICIEKLQMKTYTIFQDFKRLGRLVDYTNPRLPNTS